jgi:hypothetical protein
LGAGASFVKKNHIEIFFSADLGLDLFPDVGDDA